MKPFGTIFAFLMIAGSGFAVHAVELRGQAEQGGLLIGHAQAGEKIKYNGQWLRQTADGDFVLGFGRDAPSQTTLEIHAADGKVTRQTIAIKRRRYEEQRIDGLPPHTVEPTAEEYKRIAAEQTLIDRARARNDDRRDFLMPFIWPVHGRISGVYGSRRILNGQPKSPHAGVDIAVPQGTKIVAPADGIVTLVHNDMFYTGGTLFLQHGFGVSTMYIHLSKIFVKEGQEVKQGDLIAAAGMTGRATGPHLHWAMNWFDVRLDPALMVPPMSPATAAGSR